MRSAPPELTCLDDLAIRPWTDPVVDALGHDPRSRYVETFWLGVLGPSTTWLLRRLAAGLDDAPEGFALPLRETARSLGLGGDGRNSPFVRALTRCCQFDLARPVDDGGLEVRRRLPPLNRRQLTRLPEPLQAEHQRWVEADLRAPSDDRIRHRTRRLALSLVDLGESRDETERQLLRWRFHPALARESAAWAWEEHIRLHTGGSDAPAPADDAPRPLPTAVVGPTPRPDGPAAA